MRHNVCKYCNKKTNIIPSKFKVTTEEISQYLNKIVYDPKNDFSLFFQTQMNVVFEFLERQQCKEIENETDAKSSIFAGDITNSVDLDNLFKFMPD